MTRKSGQEDAEVVRLLSSFSCPHVLVFVPLRRRTRKWGQKDVGDLSAFYLEQLEVIYLGPLPGVHYPWTS
jgi:hypothetical protein